MVNLDFILEEASDIGFSLCGVARSRVMAEHEERFSEWFEQGYDSTLDYLRRNLDKRLDPSGLVAGARTVVVCGVNYKGEAWNQKQQRGKIASYAHLRDYHVTIKEMLTELLGRITARYPDAKGRCFTDSAPVLEKSWAVEAGLGWRGKNSLLITPRYGSFVLLGEIVLDMEADRYSAPFEGERCGSCQACMEHCPVEALRAPYVLDTRRCISCLTVERQAEGTVVEQGQLNGWIFGCDDCQSCCPYNSRSPINTLPAFDPIIEPSLLTREFWQELTQEEFDRTFGLTPMGRAGYERVRRRALDERGVD